MNSPLSSRLEQFILDEIETVPHLEAVILLWNNRPARWPVEDIARAIYVPDQAAEWIMQDLRRRMIVTDSEGGFSFNPEYEKTDLVMELETTYRRHVAQIATMIHSKSSTSAQAFARVFGRW